MSGKIIEPKKKRGRPYLPKGEAKKRYFPVRFSEVDLKTFSRAAKTEGHKSLSSWIRSTLREAIETDRDLD